VAVVRWLSCCGCGAVAVRRWWCDCGGVTVAAKSNGTGPGNNYPFRGMKATPWEGGTRVMGFLSGGFLPKQLHGRTFDRVMGVQDWCVE
jgi:hypothetical protein